MMSRQEGLAQMYGTPSESHRGRRGDHGANREMRRDGREGWKEEAFERR